jgi:hypothetical protein
MSFKPTSPFTIEMTPEQIRRYQQQSSDGFGLDNISRQIHSRASLNPELALALARQTTDTRGRSVDAAGEIEDEVIFNLSQTYRRKKSMGFGLTHSLAVIAALLQSQTKADVVFEDDYVPHFTHHWDSSKILREALSSSPEIQQALQRLHPDQTVFHPTFR